jgi:glycosyltransferase involved in cell wall biosynthesis
MAISRKADIFHIFSSDWPLGQLATMLKRLGYPYVVSTIFYQPSWIKALAHTILSRVPLTQTAWRRILLKQADLLLPNSQVEARQIRRIFGIDYNKFLIVPNAVDADFIGKAPEDFRKEYLPELPLTEPFILSVGLIEKRKNTLALVKAASKLRIPLVLIGRPNPLEKEYVNHVFYEIEKSRERSFIKHIPYIEHGPMLANTFAAAHVHALVSFNETPGIVNLEAGLNGANLVVSALPTILEYLGERHAWIVDPNNMESIANGLYKAASAPRNAKNSAKHILENFTWEKVAKKTLEGYKKILT